MDLTRFIGINESIRNVTHVPYPHAGGRQHFPVVSSGRRKAIFFGTGFRNIPGIAWDRYIELVNQCLGYMRRNCGDVELCYKPHPAETDEYSFLDLDGFQIIHEKSIADTYLEVHRPEIEYVFSVYSIVSATAYSLGFNAYMFLEIFEGAFPDTLLRWYRDVYFSEMPDEFFIHNMEDPLRPDRKAIQDDRKLEDALKRLLQDSGGTIWFIHQVSPLDVMLEVVRLVREQFPGRRIGLLLYRHRRWDKMDLPDIARRFDEVHVFPREYYSLDPRAVLRKIKLARQVRLFPIGPDDAFLCFAATEFLENCFISYHPKNTRIGLTVYRSFLVHQNSRKNPFFRGRSYHLTPAGFFYYWLLFSLLGLHRVIIAQPAGNDRLLFSFQRYQKPMNEIYDHVFYLHA